MVTAEYISQPNKEEGQITYYTFVISETCTQLPTGGSFVQQQNVSTTTTQPQTKKEKFPPQGINYL